MTRALIVVGILAVAVGVYAMVDCAFSERPARGLPKVAWFAVILLLPVIGAALWFGIGRPRAARATSPRGPEDDPTFLRDATTRTPPSVDDEETLRRFERELGLDADTEDDGEGRRR